MDVEETGLQGVGSAALSGMGTAGQSVEADEYAYSGYLTLPSHLAFEISDEMKHTCYQCHTRSRIEARHRSRGLPRRALQPFCYASQPEAHKYRRAVVQSRMDNFVDCGQALVCEYWCSAVRDMT